MNLLLIALYTKLYAFCLLLLSLALVWECAALVIALHDLMIDLLDRLQTHISGLCEQFV